MSDGPARLFGGKALPFGRRQRRPRGARIPVTVVLFNDNAYGNVRRMQRERFGRQIASDLHNPDFVRLAESFGLPAWRCDSITDYRERLGQALELDVPSLIAIPVDYSVDIAIAELGAETTRI